MNTKKALILIFLSIILVLSIVILTQKTQAKAVSNQNYHSFTKAICNENNFCQDYLFECENQEIKTATPITGAFVQFDREWQDPRTKEQIEKEFC